MTKIKITGSWIYNRLMSVILPVIKVYLLQRWTAKLNKLGKLDGRCCRGLQKQVKNYKER